MKNTLRVPAPDFNLEVTMDSGQIFGFEKSPTKEYSGEIFGQAVLLSQKAGELTVRSETAFDAEQVADYFDLGHDLGPVYRILKEDEKLSGITKPLKGLRLIRQDPWEGLACFILSSNNNVKRIQLIWRNLTDYYSRRRRTGVRRFPSALEIAQSHENILRELGLGYRAPFLLFSSKFIASNPDCLRHIREDGYRAAHERVISFPGIGPKVADCVLLYAFQKYEAFPVDVWILRAMKKLYFNNRNVSEERVHAFGQKRWGDKAGYIQQYIFHAARTGLFQL